MTSWFIHMAWSVLFPFRKNPCHTSDMPAAKRIHVLFHDAGGGHRNAAVALKAVCEQQSRPWDVNLVQFQELTEPLDVLRRLTGIRIQEQYNILLRNGWTWGSVYLLRILQFTIRIFHKPLVNLLQDYWRANPADLLISVIPHFNREMAESWASIYPGRPFVTVITDLADFPPRFWMAPGLDRVIVGSDHAVAQALEAGLPADRVTRTSGMVLHPRFYPCPGREVRERVRAELGLDEAAFVVMILYGGKGSPEIRPLSEALLRESADLFVIAVCGDNPSLYRSMQEVETGSGGRLVRLGFTDRVSDYLSACDVLATKPDPGRWPRPSTSECPRS
jgi:Monogalactosyldiacylglycerol (MGDG) synthase